VELLLFLSRGTPNASHGSLTSALRKFVPTNPTRKALSFSQISKNKPLRKQIIFAIIHLYLFSQLSARIFPKRGCGGIPPSPTPSFRRTRAEQSEISLKMGSR